MKTERLAAGLYQITKSGRVYIIERVDPRDTFDGKVRWDICEKIAKEDVFGGGTFTENVPLDAMDTLADAKYLISCWE